MPCSSSLQPSLFTCLQDAAVLLDLDRLSWPTSLGQLSWLDNEHLLVAGDSVDAINVVGPTRNVLWKTQGRRRDPNVSPNRAYVGLAGAITKSDGRVTTISPFIQVVRLRDHQVIAERYELQEPTTTRWSPDSQSIAVLQSSGVIILPVAP